MYLFASPPKTLSSTNIAAHYLSSGQKILCSLFIRDWCVCSATCLILTGRLSLLSLVKCIYDEYTTTPYIQRTFLIPLYCLVNRIARTSLEIQWDDHYYGGGWRKLQYSHKSSRVRGLWKLYGHVPECFTYKTTWITTKLLVPIDVFVIIVTMILIDTNSNVTATN